MKTRIASYGADAGSLVINGIGFNNGFGDGGFDVYYVVIFAAAISQY